MPLTVTVNTTAECLRTDCNILGDNKKKVFNICGSVHHALYWRNKSNKMQQLRFLFPGFTLHVSGDNLTHHQEYNAVYGHRLAGSLQRLFVNLQ